MMGFLIYSLVIIGLGCWPKLNLGCGYSSIGLRLLLGYAIATLLSFSMLIIGAKISFTILILAVLGLTGIIIRLRAQKWPLKGSILRLSHPGIVFYVFGFSITAIYSELNYIPVGGDEFSLWLSNAILLHTHETLKEALNAFHMPGYLPGWPLILSLPWQYSGVVNLGSSAVAPFLFYAAVSAFAYDIVATVLSRYLKLCEANIRLFSWTFLLLFLAVQAAGPLWSRTLLVEAPQTYAAVAFLLTLYAASLNPNQRNIYEWSAGTVLSAAYLIKSAAVLFAPAILLLYILKFFIEGEYRFQSTTKALLSLFRLLSPLITLVIIWTAYSETRGCMSRPLETFTTAALNQALSYDWLDLGERIFTQVSLYIFEYKLLITLIALIAVFASILNGKFEAPVIFLSTAGFYFIMLYWFHLTCFGDYYFKNLNSIPRFTRVIIWTLHSIGLVMLVEVVCKSMLALKIKKPIELFLEKKGFSLVTYAVLGVLAVVLTISVWKSVEDVSTRRYQSVDPRIHESAMAARAIDSLAGSQIPQLPKLLILSQGLNSTVLRHAYFYSLSRIPGKKNPSFTIIPENSWAPFPKNTWQREANKSSFLRTLRTADVVWPMQVDNWLVTALKPVVNDPACLAKLTGYFLIAVQSSGGSKTFLCRPKPTF